METSKVKFTRLQNQVFRLLCKRAGKELNQREIASILKVSSTAVAKATQTFDSDLISVHKDPKMNLTLIELNRDAEKAIEVKRCENLLQIYESGLRKKLNEAFPGSLIILFGSYFYGSDTFDSDIDIAIIGAEQKEISLSIYEKTLERKINLQYYSSLDNVHKNLRNNLLNGIVLKGVIEL